MSNLNLFVLLLITTTVQAEIIFQPSVLERGDRYRLVFVTTEVRDATSKDIEDYNDFVQGVADAAPIVGDWGLEWKAVASTEEVDAVDNIGYIPLNDNHFLTDDFSDLLPVYRIDGTETTNLGRGFMFAEFFSDTDAILKTELNTTLPQESTLPSIGASGGTVWTGTGSWGGASSPLGQQPGATVGGSAEHGRDVFESGHDDIEAEHHFYAISEIITAVPEPDGSILLLFGMALFIKRRSRSK